MPSVGSFVVREDLIPSGCEILKLLDKTPVSDIARDHDGIDFRGVEPAERLLPVVRAGEGGDMDVTDDAEAELRLAHAIGGEEVGWCERRRGGGGDDGFAERTTGQVEHAWLLFFVFINME